VAKVVKPPAEFLRDIVVALGLQGRPIASIEIRASVEHYPRVVVTELVEDEHQDALVAAISHYRLLPDDPPPPPG
jgi:hypothetical protein